MSPAVLFTRAKRWKQLSCPRMDEWVSKMWSNHSRTIFSLTEEGSSDTCCHTMDFEGLLLSEATHKKTTPLVKVWVSYISPQSHKFLETGSRMLGTWGCGLEEQVVFDGDRGSVREDGTLWRWMATTVVQPCECTRH